MEGLVPLLIAVGVSVAISLLKKKPAPPTESDNLPQDSPWDDLMREIERQRSVPEPAREETIYDGEAQSLETLEPEVTETFPQDDAPVAPAQVVMPPVPAPVSAVESPREIGGAPLEPEFVDFSYDDDAISLSAPELEIMVAEPLHPKPAERRVAEKPEQDSPATVTSDGEAGGDLFAGRFDPRMAVLYSEILRPKYQEY